MNRDAVCSAEAHDHVMNEMMGNVNMFAVLSAFA